MIIYGNNNTNPYLNLAAEQYLIDTPPEDDGEILTLWRNEPSVIIGRNQNAYNELNYEFIRENGVKVVRRLTGGGAVFHDLGNINFSFIVKSGAIEPLDFARFIKPVVAALNSLGLDAELSGRNDIICGGKKISGNAQCVRNGKLLHHGTLLYSADLSSLAGALNVDEEKIKSKGIKSVRGRVANIKDMLDINMDAVQFKDYLETSLAEDNKNVKIRQLSPEDFKCIAELADAKYSRWEWNWGESKMFEFTRRRYFPFGLVEIGISASGGIIKECRINGDFFGRRELTELEERLTGIRCVYEEILDKLFDIADYISGAQPEQIAGMLF